MAEIQIILDEIERVATSVNFDPMTEETLGKDIARLRAYYSGTYTIPEQDILTEMGFAVGMLMGSFRASMASSDDKHRLEVTLRGWLSRA